MKHCPSGHFLSQTSPIHAVPLLAEEVSMAVAISTQLLTSLIHAFRDTPHFH